MKLCTITNQDTTNVGMLSEKGVLNLSLAASSFNIHVPGSVQEIIRTGTSALNAIRQVAERAIQSGSTQFWQSEDEVDFGPVVTCPEKIVCVGTNYRQHAIESKMPIPHTPVLFSKFNNTLSGHRDVVRIPDTAYKMDYEVELVIVMGKTAANVSEEDALEYVFGYTVGNDLSARDLQMTTGQWLLGKTCDGFAPIGPYVTTADEIEYPNNLQLKCTVNGKLRQSSNTEDMIFNCAELISYISRHMTLKPGDIIFTGTPQGVILGYPEDQQNWLKDGDEVVVSIQLLGSLHTTLA